MKIYSISPTKAYLCQNPQNRPLRVSAKRLHPFFPLRHSFHDSRPLHLLDRLSAGALPGSGDGGGELPCPEVPVIPASCLPSWPWLSRFGAALHRGGDPNHSHRYRGGGCVPECAGENHTNPDRSAVVGECRVSLEPLRVQEATDFPAKILSDGLCHAPCKIIRSQVISKICSSKERVTIPCRFMMVP